MFVPNTSMSALIVAVLSMCCWGSWSNSLKFSEGLIRFELFYMNFSVALFAFAVVAGFTLGMIPSEGYHGKNTYLDDWHGKDAKHYLCALAAGFIFNVANLLLCKGITMLGLALAFPLCIGTALVLGTLLTYAIQPAGNFGLLLLGVSIAFIAVCVASLVQMVKDKQLAKGGSNSGDARLVAAAEAGTPQRDVNAGPSMARKLATCIVGGVLMSCWNPLVSLALGDDKNPGLSSYGELTLFTLAVVLSSMILLPIILTYPIEGGESTEVSRVIGEYRDVPFKAHFWSFAGGAIWCLGTLSNAVAGNSKSASGDAILSLAESYAIGQCANMIAILWGAFFFHEFAGTDYKVKGLVFLVCVLYIGAIASIAASSSG
jgi:glucose uptake protein